MLPPPAIVVIAQQSARRLGTPRLLQGDERERERRGCPCLRIQQAPLQNKASALLICEELSVWPTKQMHYPSPPQRSVCNGPSARITHEGHGTTRLEKLHCLGLLEHPRRWRAATLALLSARLKRRHLADLSQHELSC